MDLENMKRKYAYTLARVGLNVQKGQTVLVEAALEGWQLPAFSPRSAINWAPATWWSTTWTRPT